MSAWEAFWKGEGLDQVLMAASGAAIAIQGLIEIIKSIQDKHIAMRMLYEALEQKKLYVLGTSPYSHSEIEKMSESAMEAAKPFLDGEQ